MNEELELALRAALRGLDLPEAPASTRLYLARLRAEPRQGGASTRRRSLLPIVPLAAAIGLIALLAGGGKPTTPGPSVAPSVTPTPTLVALPTTVDGLPVQSVSELLANRAAGNAAGGPYALGGYWTNRQFMHMCAPPRTPTGDLQLWCVDGEWGITEHDEEILAVNLQRGLVAPAAGPHLTPYVPNVADQQRLFASIDSDPAASPVPSHFWAPVPIVVIGHFDDPLAAKCGSAARQACLDRFVIDRIVVFDPRSVPAPTPTPEPSPFPYADPPPALFNDAACYHGPAKSFRGWTTTDKLNIPFQREGTVYAMVTRDVIPIGNWYKNSGVGGHKTRWWAQGVCLSEEWAPGGMEFAPVNGTSFLEVDDGRHLPGGAP